MHGNPSGIDNTVACLGGAVVYQKNQPLVPLKCPDINVLLVSTETPRSTKDLVGRVSERSKIGSRAGNVIKKLFISVVHSR